MPRWPNTACSPAGTFHLQSRHDRRHDQHRCQRPGFLPLRQKTRDHVLELTTVLLDGTVWTSRPLEEQELRQVQQRTGLVGAVHRLVDAVQREQADLIAAHFPKLNRCLTGYDLAHIRDDRGRFNLNSILCGSEGTLALIAEAKLNVVPIPKHNALVNVRYGSFDAALRDAQELIRYGAASIETVEFKGAQPCARRRGLGLRPAILPRRRRTARHGREPRRVRRQYRVGRRDPGSSNNGSAQNQQTNRAVVADLAWHVVRPR